MKQRETDTKAIIKWLYRNNESEAKAIINWLDRNNDQIQSSVPVNEVSTQGTNL
ncbi:hypothetical protein [Candidatus Protochlamydia amoebophila]|uniref:hypothetical protein n=1 Tax=Candidatus Protochlamydia amoebophila TaxID=362787 RepID=UPI001BC96606|nr:hypothetical protein [Candidatus Protochlamydia amoebophila]